MASLRTFCVQIVREWWDKPVGQRAQSIHSRSGNSTFKSAVAVKPTYFPRFISRFFTPFRTAQNQKSSLLNTDLPTLSTSPIITTIIFI